MFVDLRRAAARALAIAAVAALMFVSHAQAGDMSRARTDGWIISPFGGSCDVMKLGLGPAGVTIFMIALYPDGTGITVDASDANDDAPVTLALDDHEWRGVALGGGSAWGIVLRPAAGKFAARMSYSRKLTIMVGTKRFELDMAGFRAVSARLARCLAAAH